MTLNITSYMCIILLQMNAYRVPLESTSIKYIVTAITLYLCLQKIFIKLNNKSIYIVNAPDGIPPIFLV